MPIEWIDTHCHLQMPAFAGDLPAVVARARRLGMRDAVICSTSRRDWAACARLSRTFGLHYTLGIHPYYVDEAGPDDLLCLDEAVSQAMSDPHFVGIGEIGLDGMIQADAQKQELFFARQLKMAQARGLPVSIHNRKSAPRLIKYLRRHPVTAGVLHAFNGSVQEREIFTQLGLSLGFGGALTYAGSRRIHQHAAEVPEQQWVLETDAPDMLTETRRRAGAIRTDLDDIREVFEKMAFLRGLTPAQASKAACENACLAFPRLKTVDKR